MYLSIVSSMPDIFSSMSCILLVYLEFYLTSVSISLRISIIYINFILKSSAPSEYSGLTVGGLLGFGDDILPWLFLTVFFILAFRYLSLD